MAPADFLRGGPVACRGSSLFAPLPSLQWLIVKFLVLAWFSGQSLSDLFESGLRSALCGTNFTEAPSCALPSQSYFLAGTLHGGLFQLGGKVD